MHKAFMRVALAQAQLGRGQCAPNPSVGAVVVQQGRVIASAYHLGAGQPHAEYAVLKQIDPGSPDLTLYVTLEPCNHWGRTPPCVDSIIAHGVQHVVYAYADPNPLVAENNTPALLQARGIAVTHCPMPEVDRFYQSYAHWLYTKRPWVTVKMAQSLDAKIAGKEGLRLSISNEECRQLTHQQRLESDVILTTAQTLIRDNPQLNARLGHATHAKSLAILDTHLRLPHTIQAACLAKKVHIYYDHTQAVLNPHPDWQYHPMPIQHKRLDLAAVLTHLGQQGYHDVWVEAGAHLFSALHENRLVNRTYWYVAPKHIGAQGLDASAKPIDFKHTKAMTWTVLGDNAVLTIDWG